MINPNENIKIVDDTGRGRSYEITDILYTNDDIIAAKLIHNDFDVPVYLIINRLSNVVICEQLDFYLAQNYEDVGTKYVKEGGVLFNVNFIDTIRDGGTKIIKTNKDFDFYVHMRNDTLHTSYPPTEENMIKDKTKINYILNRVHTYIERTDERLTRDKELLVDLDNSAKYLNDLPF